MTIPKVKGTLELCGLVCCICLFVCIQFSIYICISNTEVQSEPRRGVMVLSLILSSLLCAIAFGGLVWLMYSSKARARLADNQLKVVAIFVVILVVGLMLIIQSYTSIPWFRARTSGSSELSGSKERTCLNDKTKCFYSIMFDAGSTGSRIHVYRFAPKNDRNHPFELVDELFEQNHKGLSKFAENPTEGADSLRPMLDHAKDFVPNSRWTQTPLSLKATAGLRLLDPDKAQILLNAVQETFKTYPFRFVDVSIMEGSDEGIFSWYTLNFLLDCLGDFSRMMGMLDLGGASTQITLVPTSQATRSKLPAPDLHKIDLLGQSTALYSHSYLGLGLMSARFQAVGGIEDPNSNTEVNPDSFTSPCVSQTFQEVMLYNGKNYTIRGQESTDRVSDCRSAVLKFLGKYNVTPPLDNMEFSLISYFYDRAVDSALIDKDKGGYLTVQQYHDAANKVCSQIPSDKPYLCLDLIYIHTLLNTGYGFHPNKRLMLKKSIRDIEVTWALGAVVQLINKLDIQVDS